MPVCFEENVEKVSLQKDTLKPTGSNAAAMEKSVYDAAYTANNVETVQ